MSEFKKTEDINSAFNVNPDEYPVIEVDSKGAHYVYYPTNASVVDNDIYLASKYANPNGRWVKTFAQAGGGGGGQFDALITVPNAGKLVSVNNAGTGAQALPFTADALAAAIASTIYTAGANGNVVISDSVPSINADPTKYNFGSGDENNFITINGYTYRLPNATAQTPGGSAATRYLVATLNTTTKVITQAVRDTDAGANEIRLATFTMSGSTITAIAIYFSSYYSYRATNVVTESNFTWSAGSAPVIGSGNLYSVLTILNRRAMLTISMDNLDDGGTAVTALQVNITAIPDQLIAGNVPGYGYLAAITSKPLIVNKSGTTIGVDNIGSQSITSSMAFSVEWDI